MKTRTVCSAALLALLSTAALLPVGAAAAESATPVPAVGKGTIKYEQGNEKPDVTPPGEEGPEIDGPDTPEDWNPLMIVGATTLDFDTQKIGTFTADQVYNAKDFTTTETVSGDAVTTENFVKFRDIRGVKNHDYTVSAQMTKQFTAFDGTAYDEDLILKGASLGYSNASLVTTAANADNLPAVGSADTTLQTAFNLAPDSATGSAAGDSVTVLSTKGQKGFGVFDIKFGELGTTSQESVKLTVPKSNQLTTNTYQGEITWTIAEIPATPGA